MRFLQTLLGIFSRAIAGLGAVFSRRRAFRFRATATLAKIETKRKEKKRPSFVSVIGTKLRELFSVLIPWLTHIRFKFLVIEKYIFAEVWSSFLLGMFGFTVFMIISSIFTLGDKIFGKHIPPFTVLKVMLLATPAYLVLAVPVATLFATLMAMGRLGRDNEITALYTTGVSLYRIFLPFLAIAVFAGLGSFLTYEYIVPPNNREFKNTLAVFWESQVIDFLKPGIVIKAPEKKYLFIDKLDKERGIIYGLRLYDYGEGRSFPRLYLAESARMEGGFLRLENVRVYEPQERNGSSIVCAVTPTTRVNIARRIREFTSEDAPQELSTKELKMRIEEQRKNLKFQQVSSKVLRLKYNTDLTEYYFKFAIPFASVVLVLVAVPLSIRGPREERNLAIILTFLVVMSYYALFFACRTLGYLGHLPGIVAGWLPNLAFIIAGTFLLIFARK